MGLSISAYENVKLLKVAPLSDEDFDRDDAVHIYPMPPFEAAADGLQDGLYQVSGEALDFGAGSYGGYNIWRNLLCRMAFAMEAESLWEATPAAGPFLELINFADNEGAIGPKTSAKLAADFVDWKDRANSFFRAHGEPWHWEAYLEWMRAFQLAARGGAVRFH